MTFGKERLRWVRKGEFATTAREIGLNETWPQFLTVALDERGRGITFAIRNLTQNEAQYFSDAGTTLHIRRDVP